MYKLKYLKGHMYVEIDSNDWLIDTGSPSSFGCIDKIEIANKTFTVQPTLTDLGPTTLSQYVDHEVAGLLGTGILNEFYIVFDIKGQVIIFSDNAINLKGEVLNIEETMGVPVIRVQINNKEINAMFDTGAQLSYFQKEIIDQEKSLGTIKDFYPGIGYFETKTAMIDVKIGQLNYQLKSGYLPNNMNMGLLMTGTEGIIGNDVMIDSTIGYFPKDNKLVFVR